MKSLGTLIKLYKKRLDDKRLELLREEETLEELKKILARIQNEMHKETGVARKSLEASYSFPIYIEQAMNTEKRMIKLIGEQEKKIETIRDQMAEEFAELKKYEILRDIKIMEEKKEEDRMEQLQLDEIAANSFLLERKEDGA